MTTMMNDLQLWRCYHNIFSYIFLQDILHLRRNLKSNLYSMTILSPYDMTFTSDVIARSGCHNFPVLLLANNNSTRFPCGKGYLGLRYMGNGRGVSINWLINRLINLPKSFKIAKTCLFLLPLGRNQLCLVVTSYD